MNLAQTIHTKACEAAASLAGDLTAHEMATSELDAFKGQNFDPLDYSEWLVSFRARRAQLMVEAADEQAKMTQLAARKTQSEAKAAAAKPTTEAKV